MSRMPCSAGKNACMFGQISRCLSSSIIRSVDIICTFILPSVSRVGNDTTPWDCLSARGRHFRPPAGGERAFWPASPLEVTIPESSPDDLVSSLVLMPEVSSVQSDQRHFPSIITPYQTTPPFGRRRYPRSPINLPIAYASGRNREYRLIPMYRPSYPPGSV